MNNEYQLYHEHEEEAENGGRRSALCRDIGRECQGQKWYETLWGRLSEGGPKPSPAHTASVVPRCPASSEGLSSRRTRLSSAWAPSGTVSRPSGHLVSMLGTWGCGDSLCWFRAEGPRERTECGEMYVGPEELLPRGHRAGG